MQQGHAHGHAVFHFKDIQHVKAARTRQAAWAMDMQNLHWDSAQIYSMEIQ